MDLSNISSKDLEYLKLEQYDKVSTKGLEEFKKQINMPSEAVSEDLGVDAQNFKLSKDQAGVGTRFYMGLQDPFVGATQLASRGIDKILGKETEFTKDFDAFAKSREQKYAPVEGIDFARMAGNVFNPASFLAASKIPQVVGLGKKVGLGAATGAGFAATAPVTGDDFAKEKSEQLQSGAVVGSLFPLAGSTIQRFISPKASQNPQLQLLEKEGVSPTIGQRLGGVFNKYEEVAEKFPIVGDIVSKQRGRAQEEFRTTIFNQALKPIGKQLPKNLKGRDAINYVSKELEDSYTNTLNKIGAVQLDDEFVKNTNSLTNMIMQSKMPEKGLKEYNFQLSEIARKINSKNVITSEDYKAIESMLSKNSVKFGTQDSVYANKLQQATKQLKANFQSALERHAKRKGNIDGEDLSVTLRNTNEAWARFKRIQKASTTAGADLGEFTPKQFNQAVKALDKSKDKSQFAKGSALLQDFSESGQKVLGETMNNNPYLRAAYAVGTGVGLSLFSPSALFGLLSTGAIYNPAVQKILGKTISSRPSFAPQLANKFGSIVPYSQATIPSLLIKEDEWYGTTYTYPL